jgi:WD40 repeat protein
MTRSHHAGVVVLVTLGLAGPAWCQQADSEPAIKEMLHGRLIGPKGYFRQLVFSPDGKVIAAGLMQGTTVSLFDVAAGKERLRLQMPEKNYDYHLAFSADGRTIVSEGREDEMIRTWDAVTGRQLREVKKPAQMFLAFAPGGKEMIFTDRGLAGDLEVFEVATGKRIRQIKDVSDCRSCTFSKDGKLLAVHGGFGAVALWDPATGKMVRQLREPPDRGGAAFAFTSFSPDGMHLATGGHIDNNLRVWEVNSGKERLCLPCKGFFVSASFSPDGTLLATGSTDGLTVHDLLSGKELLRLGRAVHGQFVAFSPDGSLLAVAGETADGEAAITLFDMPKRRKDSLPRELRAAQLDSLWDDITAENDFRLQRVLATLRAVPGQAVPFLRQKMQPVPEAESQRVKKLVQALDDDDATKRDKAMHDLQEMAAAFEPRLMEIRRDAEPGEVRNRVQAILREAREAPVPRRLLAQLRAVSVLEQIGTPQAREVLKSVAGGAGGARLTQEARQALERLERPRRDR